MTALNDPGRVVPESGTGCERFNINVIEPERDQAQARVPDQIILPLSARVSDGEGIPQHHHVMILTVLQCLVKGVEHGLKPLLRIVPTKIVFGEASHPGQIACEGFDPYRQNDINGKQDSQRNQQDEVVFFMRHSSKLKI